MNIKFGPYRIVNPNAEKRLLEEGFSFLRNSQMEMAEERFKKILIEVKINFQLTMYILKL